MSVTTSRLAEPRVDEPDTGPDVLDLDITVFESGAGLDEIVRMTDDGCGTTCESACNSCPD